MSTRDAISVPNIIHSDYFFFQAEYGIRDGHVTGVQTCALPISLGRGEHQRQRRGAVLRRAGRPRRRWSGARLRHPRGRADALLRRNRGDRPGHRRPVDHRRAPGRLAPGDLPDRRDPVAAGGRAGRDRLSAPHRPDRGGRVGQRHRRRAHRGGRAPRCVGVRRRLLAGGRAAGPAARVGGLGPGPPVPPTRKGEPMSQPTPSAARSAGRLPERLRRRRRLLAWPAPVGLVFLVTGSLLLGTVFGSHLGGRDYEALRYEQAATQYRAQQRWTGFVEQWKAWFNSGTAEYSAGQHFAAVEDLRVALDRKSVV